MSRPNSELVSRPQRHIFIRDNYLTTTQPPKKVGRLTISFALKPIYQQRQCSLIKSVGKDFKTSMGFVFKAHTRFKVYFPTLIVTFHPFSYTHFRAHDTGRILR